MSIEDCENPLAAVLRVARRPMLCPQCGSEPVVPIAYGYPSAETLESARQDHVVLGGCTADQPSRVCRSCGHQWASAQP
jgi:hypothetical protein